MTRMEDWLLPRPQRVVRRDGDFELTEGWVATVPAALEVPERLAFQELVTALTILAGPPKPGFTGAARQSTITFRVDDRGDWSSAQPESYRLTIEPGNVDVVGRTSAGLLQGIRTLLQIARSCGRCWSGAEIEDWPAFAVRGFYHDVTRGKVPTLPTLQMLVDRLAALKVNQFQIYVEHVFDFRFDPAISRGCSPLTAEEIRALDAYCRDRRIDFVPSLASFGHMARVLSLPPYRDLAEIEATCSWEEMSWYHRVRGLTLDPYNPRSRELLEKMYAEYVPLFSTTLMNACADETFDLGKGKNKEKADREGTGRLYVDHILFLHDLARRYGKRLMIWGDVVSHHPEMVNEIPKDTVLMHWLYFADSDFDSTALFQKAGLQTYVCPGCSGWNRFVNGINNADLNIRRFAAAGVRYGAAGLLNTDWGDEGHVNFLACSWHPIYTGAAMGWNPSGPGPDDFDRIFDFLLFGRRDGKAAAALREVATVGDRLDQWRIFYAALDNHDEHMRMGLEAAARAERAGLAAAALFEEYERSGYGDPQDCAELGLACRLVALTGSKVRLADSLQKARQGAADASLAGNAANLAEEVRLRGMHFRILWRNRNKVSEVEKVTAVFDRVASEAQTAANHSQTRKEP